MELSLVKDVCAGRVGGLLPYAYLSHKKFLNFLYEGSTALHLATRSSNEKLIDHLLEAGADVHILDKDGNSALKIALSIENIDVAKKLIDAGADVNTADSEGLTTLHAAASTNDAELIQYLLSLGANVNAKDVKGGTPLHVAAATNTSDSHLSAFKVLLSKNADPNAKDADSLTPVHFVAGTTSTTEIIDLFLDYRADFNVKDKNGITPLHLAIIMQQKNMQKNRFNAENFKLNVHMIKYLVKKGADPNMVDSDGWSPFLYAMYSYFSNSKFLQDEVKLISFLLEYADINKVDSSGHNILSDTLFSLPESVWKTVLKHIARLKILQLPVDKSLLHAILNKHHYTAYFKKCTQELTTAKSSKLYDSWVTYFHLLNDDKSKLMKYAGNKDLVEDFKKTKISKKFPIYGALMKKKVSKAIKNRNIWDNAAVILSTHLPVFDSGHLIIKEVINCFTVKELLTICDSKY